MHEFRDNHESSRYERAEPEGLVFADYRAVGSVRRILHVETPAALRGRGLAGLLMADMVAHARAHGLRLQPLCSYAAAYSRRHREDADVFV